MLLLVCLTNFPFLLVIAQNKATNIFESEMFPLKMYVAWPTKRQLSPYLNAFISCTVFVTAVYSF